MGTVFADVREDLVAAAVPASPRPELAVAWVGDLASRGALRRFVGCRTHFVHSAAAQRHEADHALAVTTETWERMRAVNVDAGFHLARELARPLIAARQPGSFLMLTSLHAGTPGTKALTRIPKCPKVLASSFTSIAPTQPAALQHS